MISSWSWMCVANGYIQLRNTYGECGYNYFITSCKCYIVCTYSNIIQCYSSRFFTHLSMAVKYRWWRNMEQPY